jgi:hypothetical protein
VRRAPCSAHSEPGDTAKPTAVRQRAPLLDEHTRAIIANLLGVADDVIAREIAAGILV